MDGPTCHGTHDGKISIDFDDLTHTYRRLTYRLEHCEADWKPSVGLFESDIVDGFIAGNTIDNVKESTLQTLFIHIIIWIFPMINAVQSCL